ncbi:hypothetical protein ACJJIQ_06580 [Microbulbifer sp. ANSA003]|uniref:hypothetical protein n=1 Tax=Microbulbifer sp. ANSA003 TaxID=3243360 RepID=UPI00404153B3
MKCSLFLMAILVLARPVFAEDKEFRDLITSHENNLAFMYDLLEKGIDPNREAQLYTNLLVGWISFASVAVKYSIQSDMLTPRRVCEMTQLMDMTYPKLLNSPKGVYPIQMVSYAHKSAISAMKLITSEYRIDCEEYFKVKTNLKGRLGELKEHGDS